MSTASRLGPLAAAAGLLIAGSFEAGPGQGVALMAAGMIVIGAWLAIEVWYQRHDMKYDHSHDDHHLGGS